MFSVSNALVFNYITLGWLKLGIRACWMQKWLSPGGEATVEEPGLARQRDAHGSR